MYEVYKDNQSETWLQTKCGISHTFREDTCSQVKNFGLATQFHNHLTGEFSLLHKAVELEKYY